MKGIGRHYNLKHFGMSTTVVRRAMPCKGSLRRVSSRVVRRELQSACDFWILRTFTKSTHGRRSSFSQNSQKWHPFSENVRFSLIFSEFVYCSADISENLCFSWICFEFVRFFMEFYWIILEIYKFYPLETCAIFAEFAKMTPFFWKRAFSAEI